MLVVLVVSLLLFMWISIVETKQSFQFSPKLHKQPQLILIAGCTGTGKSTFGMSVALSQSILKVIFLLIHSYSLIHSLIHSLIYLPIFSTIIVRIPQSAFLPIPFERYKEKFPVNNNHQRSCEVVMRVKGIQ